MASRPLRDSLVFSFRRPDLLALGAIHLDARGLKLSHYLAPNLDPMKQASWSPSHLPLIAPPELEVALSKKKGPCSGT